MSNRSALDLSTRTIKIYSGAFDATARADISEHVADNENPHSVTAAQVGLGAADNTADIDKPISTATQAALSALVTDVDNAEAALAAHAASLANPHSVTKVQVGLGSADNTSDANKPVSTAQAAALALKAPLASPGLTGVPTAPTAAPGTISEQLATTQFVQAAVNTIDVGSVADDLAEHEADTANPHAVTKSQIGLGAADNTSDAAKPISAATQTAINAVAASVTTVAGDIDLHEANTSNPHGVTADQVGLGNVDDTADADKPVSDATQLAINAAVAGTADVASDLAAHTANVSNPHVVTKGQVGLGAVDNTADLAKPISTATQSALNTKAGLDSPEFTGVPAAPTAAPGTATTQIATTEFVDTVSDDLAAHTANTNNPHEVTAEQVGLGNVDNTSDADKPLSDAALAVLDALAAPERPGDAVELYGTSATGTAEAMPRVDPAWVVASAAGNVVRVTAATAADPQVIAPIAAFAVEAGQSYEVRWKVQRVIDPIDPLNDSVTLAIRWLDKDKAGIAGAAGIATIANLPLVIANSLVERSVRIGLSTTYAPPAGAVYARPYVQMFGDSHITDVVVIEFGSASADYSVLDFGAVRDGVDTGSAFTGTDNRAAFQAALNAASAARRPLLVPPGTYRFAGVTVNDTAVLTLPSYCWIIGPGAVLLVDEDTSITNAVTRDFMRSTGWQTTLDRNTLELCHIDGVTFKGRWSHGPLTTAAAKGIHFFAGANYREVMLSGVRAFDCRGNFSRSFGCEVVSVTGCHFERICSDAIRFTDSPNVLVDGNFIKDTGDNAISLHSAVTRTGATYISRPARAGLIVTNNRMVGCVPCVALGPHTIVFSNNIMQRCNGGVTIGLQAPPEGTGTQSNISVQGNIIEDTLQRWGGSFPAQTRATGVLTIGGAPATHDSSPVAPGEYDPASASVVSLWGTSPTPTWGYLWSANSATIAGALEHSNAGAVNIRVSDNTISRTLPLVAKFSDWGFGQLFAVTGYADPPIGDTDFRRSGLVLSADIRNFVVSGNIFSGLRGGPGIFLHVAGTEELGDNMFRGGIIKGNLFSDCAMGMTSAYAGDLVSPDRSVEILIEGNHFDIDPYYKSTFRTSPIDGSWPSSNATADFPCGINVNGYKGFIIRGNSFANVYIPVGPTPLIASQLAHMENNVCICDPAAVGHSISNKGIAHVPPAGPAYRHLIVDCNPTSATWRRLRNTCAAIATGMPTAGTYVQGQFINNSAPAVVAGKVLLGWARLTTGSTHIDGTDWSPLYCAVS